MSVKFLNSFENTVGDVLNVDYELLRVYRIIEADHPWYSLLGLCEITVDDLMEQAREDVSPNPLQRLVMEKFVADSNEWVVRCQLDNFQTCLYYLFDKTQLNEDFQRLQQLHIKGCDNSVYQADAAHLVNAYRSVMAAAFNVMSLLHGERLKQDWKSGSMSAQREVLRHLLMPVWRRKRQDMLARYQGAPGLVLIDICSGNKGTGIFQDVMLPSMCIVEVIGTNWRRESWGTQVILLNLQAEIDQPTLNVWLNTQNDYTGAQMAGLWLLTAGLLDRNIRLIWVAEDTLGGIRMLLDLHAEIAAEDNTLDALEYANLYVSALSDKPVKPRDIFGLLEYILTRESFIQAWHVEHGLTQVFAYTAAEWDTWLASFYQPDTNKPQTCLFNRLDINNTNAGGQTPFLRVPKVMFNDRDSVNFDTPWINSCDSLAQWLEAWLTPYTSCEQINESQNKALEILTMQSLECTCLLHKHALLASRTPPISGEKDVIWFDLLLRAYIGLSRWIKKEEESSCGVKVLKTLGQHADQILSIGEVDRDSVLGHLAFVSTFLEKPAAVNLINQGMVSDWDNILLNRVSHAFVIRHGFSTEHLSFLKSWNEHHHALFEDVVFPYFCQRWNLLPNLSNQNDKEENTNVIYILTSAIFDLTDRIRKKAELPFNIDADIFDDILLNAAKNLDAHFSKGGQYDTLENSFDIRMNFEEYAVKYCLQVQSVEELHNAALDSKDGISDNFTF